MLSRGIANGIGLAREYNEHRKQQKASGSPEPSVSSSPADVKVVEDVRSDERFENDDDEDAWEVDDLQDDEPKDTPPTIQKAKNVAQLLEAFQRLHPPPAAPVKSTPLSMPVILPQRRPRHRDRGFVRAYSPVLQQQSIDQKTFFDFLDGFERAIRLHPVFHAVNLAVWTAVKAVDIAAGPSLTLHAAAFIAHSSIEASRRGMIVHETNRYLDGINVVLFKPRGMYAMIMTFKPDSDKPIEELAASDDAVDSVAKRNDGAGGKLSLSSGKTHGELAIPELAPLVFPQFDAMNEEKKASRIKDLSNFYSEHQDKIARAQYDHANPDSKLAVPGTTFVSRYSDPTSPAVNGGLSGLITGGRRPGLIYRLKQRHDKNVQGQPRGPRRLLTQNVYYLAIVNMPTEAELQQALAA